MEWKKIIPYHHTPEYLNNLKKKNLKKKQIKLIFNIFPVSYEKIKIKSVEYTCLIDDSIIHIAEVIKFR